LSIQNTILWHAGCTIVSATHILQLKQFDDFDDWERERGRADRYFQAIGINDKINYVRRTRLYYTIWKVSLHDYCFVVYHM